MKRVLVTGASGFIGSPCVQSLVAEGWDVHAIHPDTDVPPLESVTWHSADLLDPAATRAAINGIRPSHLLHLAWFVAPGEYWRSTENLRWLSASLELVSAFAEAGGERVVIAGTCAEYAQHDVPLVPGVTPLRPATLYGAAKAALHLSALELCRELGVSCAWGHIFYLFGEREHPARLVPAAIRTMRAGEKFAVAHPGDVKDFLHVHDVASAFIALLASAVEGDVNVCSGEGVRVGDLVAEIAELLDRKALLSLDETAVPAAPIIGDATRLAREVGWTPSLSRHEALRQTVAWWAEHERGLIP